MLGHGCPTLPNSTAAIFGNWQLTSLPDVSFANQDHRGRGGLIVSAPLSLSLAPTRPHLEASPPALSGVSCVAPVLSGLSLLRRVMGAQVFGSLYPMRLPEQDLERIGRPSHVLRVLAPLPRSLRTSRRFCMLALHSPEHTV